LHKYYNYVNEAFVRSELLLKCGVVQLPSINVQITLNIGSTLGLSIIPPDDGNIDLYCSMTLKDGGKHCNALLGKGVGKEFPILSATWL
jgi:hypothetical protein